MAGDGDLVARLRAGDESAFATLVDQYHSSLIRLAATYVPSRAVAEEVVQDTWLGVIRGIDRFEGRSSVKTWLFRILVNRARSTGPRERRTVSLDDGDAGVDTLRLGTSGHRLEPSPPWTDDVDDRLMAAGIVERVRVAVDALPPGQRQVVVLHDVEGLSSIEVCSVLGISEGNQRVLLHRGRSSVRRGFAQELGRE